MDNQAQDHVPGEKQEMRAEPVEALDGRNVSGRAQHAGYGGGHVVFVRRPDFEICWPEQTMRV